MFVRNQNACKGCRVIQTAGLGLGLVVGMSVLTGCPVEETPPRETTPRNTDPAPGIQPDQQESERTTPRSDQYDDLD